MPHLQLLGRIWRIASDEFWISGSCTVVFRFAWSIFLIALILNSTTVLSKCSDNWTVFLYLCGSFLICATTFACEVVILRISILDTIPENTKRDNLLVAPVTFHIFLAVLQLVAAIVGSLIVWKQSSIPCASEFDESVFDDVMLSFIVVSQFVDFVGLLCCCRLLDSTTKESQMSAADPNREEAVWENRTQCLCKCARYLTCNILGGGNIGDDLTDFAKMLTIFFHHEGFLDVVPSDVAAGIILVRIKQLSEAAKRVNLTRSPLASNETSTLDKSNADVESGLMLIPKRLDSSDQLDRRVLEELATFSTYALAVYSHIFALVMQPVTGICGLCATRATDVGLNCKCLKKPGDRVVEGDNCWSLNETGTIHISNKFSNAQLVFASFHNDTLAKPYAIFYDEGQNTVIMSFRGTLSLEDCVTDILCCSAEMKEAGATYGFDGAGRFAHGGMLKAALFLRKEIEEKGVVDRLLENPKSFKCCPATNSPSTRLNTPQEKPRLVIVGHSLGAGTAVLLALLFRSKYPNLQCITYGTPACVVDPVTAKECECFVTSCVLAADVVSRMSLDSVLELRNEVLDCLSRAKVNKMAVMQAMFNTNRDVDKYLWPPSETPLTPFRQCILDYQKCINDRFAGLENAKLVIPGKVIHIQRTQTDKKLQKASCCCKRCCLAKEYVAMETHMDHFDRIDVSPDMLRDHFPDLYVRHLRELLE